MSGGGWHNARIKVGRQNAFLDLYTLKKYANININLRYTNPDFIWCLKIWWTLDSEGIA